MSFALKPIDKRIQQVLEEVKALKDYNKNIDHSLIDLSFKEYDLGALFVKDFYDASKSIALSPLTLLGSDWAQNEQKLMKLKQELNLEVDQVLQSKHLT